MSVKEPKPVGRPNEYTKEIGDKFCELIAQGLSLRSVCAMDDMPAPSTIFKWMREQPIFSKQYAQACEERTEAQNEQLLELGDEAVTLAQSSDPKAANAIVAAVRLKADNLRWVMSKQKPKKYGDKIELDNTGEITHKYEEMTDEQLDQAIKARQDRITGTGS